jgi:hypothetical protein
LATARREWQAVADLSLGAPERQPHSTAHVPAVSKRNNGFGRDLAAPEQGILFEVIQ